MSDYMEKVFTIFIFLNKLNEYLYLILQSLLWISKIQMN